VVVLFNAEMFHQLLIELRRPTGSEIVVACYKQ